MEVLAHFYNFVHTRAGNQTENCMKTFDFAYWVSSLDKIPEDAHPTDRFPLKASTIAHGMKDGLIEATRRITHQEMSFREITAQKEVSIAKITIVEL